VTSQRSKLMTSTGTSLGKPSCLTSGLSIIGTSITLPWAPSNLEPSTLHGYKQAINQHLKPRFRTTPLKDITTPSATKFLGQFADDEQGERTISHVKWIASGIYKHAIATGFASQNHWPDARCLVKAQPPTKTRLHHN